MTTPPSTEDRLRATLRAVAEARPVADDLAAVRARAGDHVVALDAHRPHRSRLLLVAAVLVTALAVGGVVVAARGGNDADEGVRAVDPPAATGWYLPEGLGTEWDLTAVAARQTSVAPTLVRQAYFFDPAELTRSSEQAPVLIATEYLVDTPPGDLPGTPLDRDGEGQAPARVPQDGLDRTWAQRDGRLLVVDTTVLTRADALDVLDRWWASGGLDISIDESLGLPRTADIEVDAAIPGPPPAPISPQSVTVDETFVTVAVRHRATGEDLAYVLSPEGTVGLPTGGRDADGGAARGIAPADRPIRLDLPAAPGPVWAASPERWATTSSRVVGSFPGAVVGAGLRPQDVLLDATGASNPPGLGGAAEGPTRELSIALVGDLRPASAAAWADAVGALDGGDGATGPSLDDVEAPDEESTSTTFADDGTPIEPTTTEPVLEQADPDPNGMGPRDPDTVAAAAALVDFARDPSDETFAALPLADIVTLGRLHADGGSREVAAAELRDPDAWVVPSGAADPTALELLAGPEALQALGIYGGPEGCPGFVTLDMGPTSLSVEPLPWVCDDSWFSVMVLTEDDGLITGVAVYQ